ncbi:MAG TPA: arabinofuranosidase catalytic domain-containing protein [Streptosporangiaceae bacterium]|nr:arabinofuranosidase catalytic domain-containing protein [Streptosporangiaceae bacterium]
MTVRSRSRLPNTTLLALGAATALAVGAMVAGIAPQARAAAQGPCDIYASGGTPCVAAHSTTRALFAAYDGSLYQVRRSSDGATLNIGPLSAGGAANAAAQDSFCAGTSCVITEIFDQSGHNNNLTDAPGGGAAGGPDNLANATAAPAWVGGHHVYGVFVAPGTGYRDDATSGIATGDQSEGEYAIFDGTHFNGGCCFDYGNAETSNNDTGAGHMEAIYFGNIKVWGFGTGNGPWIMADMENGLYSGSNAGFNANDPTTSFRFTTAMVEGEANQWAILGGNAQSGGLATDFSGVRPAGYNPMHKEGAIILGIGGDNSKGAAGTFYEGVMTSGYPSAATENAVQANIVAAGYSTTGSSANTVTVTSPGNQTSTVGTAASVQVHASDSASGQTLSYTASGLPAGLTINSGTGLISGTPTTAGSPTVTVTATDTTGASGSATFTWTVKNPTTGGGTCQVGYATQSQWAGGFVAGLTITDTGTAAISGWTLTFTFPGDQKITTAWNGTASQSGENVTITNASYNGTIAPGTSTSLGFQGTWNTSDAVPSSFTVNGTACST